MELDFKNKNPIEEKQTSKNEGKKKKERKKNIPETDIEEFAKVFIKDINIQKILENNEQQKKEEMRKKIRAKINMMRQNRIPENIENVKYDAKGNKVGRLEKQFLNFPTGEITNPFDIQRITHILKAIENDPVKKKLFMEKSGIPENICKDILNSAKDNNEESRFELIEEIL